jgi:hypothetical protein
MAPTSPGETGKDHVRLDKPGGYQATADFLMAVTKKYGDDPRIASITHGEYYTNADAGGLPADFDDAAFKNNAELIWQGVIAAAPRDANGERVNFVQSMPQTSGGHTTAAEIRAIGVGVSGSDLFNEGPVQRLQNVLYGVVPLQQRRGRSRGSEIGPNNGTSSL